MVAVAYFNLLLAVRTAHILGGHGGSSIYLHHILMPPTKKKNHWVLVLVTVMLCLGSMEVALRMLSPLQRYVGPFGSFFQFDPQLGWVGIPNLDARFCKVDFDVHVRHDANGYRMKQSGDLPAGTPVAVFLGDSFTWGWGVENGQVVTDVVQTCAGSTLDVKNFGVNVYGTLQESLLLQKLLSEGLKPSVVVVLFFQNDFSDTVGLDERRPSVEVKGSNIQILNSPVHNDHLSRGFVRRLLNSSRLFQTIAYVSNLWKEHRNAKALASTVYKDEAVSTEAEAGVAYSLRQLQKSCLDSGARLVVAYIPGIRDIQVIQQTPWVETLLRACKSNQIELLDLTPAFKAASLENPTKLYFPNDEHWTAQGHQVAGEFINAYLQHK